MEDLEVGVIQSNDEASAGDVEIQHGDDASAVHEQSAVDVDDICDNEMPSIEPVREANNIGLSKASHSPNIPHPSLEFPPLYFLLSCFPSMRDYARKFYNWRWSMSYPLQKRVKGSKALRKLKIHLTYGEVLIFIPLLVLAIICIYQTFLEPSVKGTGKAARLAVAAALLFGQKNSYITMVLGIPFDRAVAYHKISGYVAVFTGLMHTMSYYIDHDNKSLHKTAAGKLSEVFAGSMNSSGTGILLSIVCMFLTSLPVLRKKLFEVFYFVHMTLLVGIIVGTAFHTGWMVPLFVFLTTGVDMIIRKIYMARFRYPREASLKIVSESVVEISFPKVKGFDYNPGQYMYISIPELSSWEWHPFSISTAPHQSKVSFHIRVAGNWTTALHELALHKKTVPILMEGPYGNFGVDVMNDKRYKMALLMSGGKGLTPMQSMFSHLIHEQSNGFRDLKKLKFVWVQRDPEFMHQSRVMDASTTLHNAKFPLNDHDSDAGDYSLASGLLHMIPAGRETDQELDELYPSMDFSVEDPFGDTSQSDSNEDKIFYADDSNLGEEKPKGDSTKMVAYAESPEIYMQDQTNVSELATLHHLDPTFHSTHLNLQQVEDCLDIEIYLTKKDEENADIPGVKFGRPDLKKIFNELRKEAIKNGEKRIAVCVCGPSRITDLCRKACIQLSDKDVRFDFHQEEFG